MFFAISNAFNCSIQCEATKPQVCNKSHCKYIYCVWYIVGFDSV